MKFVALITGLGEKELAELKRLKAKYEKK